MAIRVRINNIRRLGRQASKIGFRETQLRLEGICEHISAIGSLEGKKREDETAWLLRKIECSRSAIRNELGDEDAPGFFYWRKEVEFKVNTLIGIAANAAAGIFMAAQICRVREGDLTGAVIGGLAFVGTLIYMIGNTLMKRFASYSRFRNRIESAVTQVHRSMRGYVDDDRL